MMMSYEEFKNKFQESIVELLEPGCTFRVCVVHKPNLDKEALSIAKPANPEIGINLYLDDLYNDYFCWQVDFDDILKAAADMINRDNVSNVISLDDIFGDVRETVFPCVINTEKNKEFLETVPHRAFLNLSVIYKKKVEDVDGAAVTISNAMLGRIGMTEQELYDAAVKNMVGLNGIFLDNMSSVLSGLLGTETEDVSCVYRNREELEKLEIPRVDGYGSVPLYVASNERRVHGASVFLVPELWKGITKVLDESVYILPSSIHELLFMKESACVDPSGLVDMIHEVNHSHVLPEEFLSDNLYYYNKETGEISIVA